MLIYPDGGLYLGHFELGKESGMGRKAFRNLMYTKAILSMVKPMVSEDTHIMMEDFTKEIGLKISRAGMAKRCGKMGNHI